jgi:hypothetical protein
VADKGYVPNSTFKKGDWVQLIELLEGDRRNPKIKVDSVGQVTNADKGGAWVEFGKHQAIWCPLRKLAAIPVTSGWRR